MHIYEPYFGLLTFTESTRKLENNIIALSAIN